MASRQAPPAPAGTGEVSEREYQATLNRAVADTEEEIFGDALGSDELDNDGDTSLEEMGDGLEGEVEDDDAQEDAEGEGEDGEERAEGEDGDEAESAEGEADADDGGDAEAARDQEGRFQRRREPAQVPSGRVKEEADRRRAAEERAQTLERQVAEMNGRLAELSARQNAPPPRAAQTEAPPKPDMFAEQDKYEAWLLAEAERKADARAAQRYTEFEQRQQAISAQRVDESLAMAARGDRSFEFGAAYNALTSLNPNDPKARATVAKIYNSADAAQALFDWWEQNGAPEYRERILEQLAPRQQRNGQRGRGPDDRSGDRRGEQQPRHVIRPAQRLPSLNSATGSNSQRVSDPEMLDGSDPSIWNFATRR